MSRYPAHNNHFNRFALSDDRFSLHTNRNTEICPPSVQVLDGTKQNALCLYIYQPLTVNCRQVRQMTFCSSDTQWLVHSFTDTETQLINMPTL